METVVDASFKTCKDIPHKCNIIPMRHNFNVILPFLQIYSDNNSTNGVSILIDVADMVAYNASKIYVGISDAGMLYLLCCYLFSCNLFSCNFSCNLELQNI